MIPLLHDLQDLLHALPQLVSDIRESDAFKSLDQQVDFGAELQTQAADLAARVPDTLATSSASPATSSASSS